MFVNEGELVQTEQTNKINATLIAFKLTTLILWHTLLLHSTKYDMH